MGRVFVSGVLADPMKRYEGLADNRSVKGCCELCGRVYPAARVWLYHRGRLIGTAVHEVTLLRAKTKYTEIWSRDGFVGVTETGIGQLMAAHPSEWVRCHRNAAVRPESVHRLTFSPKGSSCVVEGVPDEVAISRRAWSPFRDAVVSHSKGKSGPHS